MAKTRQQKEQTYTDLVVALKASKSAVFANFQGLTVKATEELRGICRKEQISFVASKKTLLKKALNEVGLDIDTKSFDGGVAVVLGTLDEVAPAQIVAEFAKTHVAVKIFGGILEGNAISGSKVEALSKLPSKIQLYSKLVGTLNAPISGFVNVLAGNMRGLVTVLNAIKDAKA